LIDSREQAPFTFTGYYVDSETATLPVGDYSLPGFEDRAAIERKSLNDLISCLMSSNRERFEKELAKGRLWARWKRP
jgi:DNA excision repair protein ERCC-4